MYDNQEQSTFIQSSESPPEAESGRTKRRRPGFLAGFISALILAAIALVCWQGYLQIPLGSLGVFSLRMPWYKVTAADGDDLNMKEVNRKMKEIQALLDSTYLYDEDPQTVSDGIFTGMLYGLTGEDKYAQYYTVRSFEAETKRNNGSYEGIGVTVQTDPATGGILVVSVNSQGPAREAGIQVDDVIIMVDGVDLRGMSLDEAVAEHVTGPAGTSIELTLLRGEEELTMTVDRATILDITVRGIMLEDTGLGYISITSFNRTTVGEFKKVWSELRESGAKGMVVDLRNNGGGDMDVCLSMLDYILDDHLQSEVQSELDQAASSVTGGRTLLLTVEDKEGHAGKYYADDGVSDSLPVVVIVNGRSASASEIFTGVLMDYGYSSVGEKTFGKGIVQSVYKLSDNSAVKFTTHQYRLPGGELIHGTGIEPTLQVEFEEFDDVSSAMVNFAGGEETDLWKDNQIRAAAELLLNGQS